MVGDQAGGVNEKGFYQGIGFDLSKIGAWRIPKSTWRAKVSIQRPFGAFSLGDMKDFYRRISD
jgi:hypothetical protein